MRKYAKQFDIVILIETHKEATKRISLGQGWFTSTTPAIKTASKGRASGGLLIGIKRELASYTEMKKTKLGEIYIEINTANGKRVIFPTYLNCNKWKEDLWKLEENIKETKNDNIMIIGDLNARVGNSQTISLDSPRNRISRDSTINKNGEELLEMLQDLDLQIANGSTRSDEEGQYTFINNRGKSVIDLCAVGGKWKYEIEDLEVEARMGSDHMPVVVKANIGSVELKPIQNTNRRILKWRKNDEGIYKERIINIMEENPEQPTIGKMETIIKLAHRNRKPLKKNSPWYNYKCDNQRKKTLGWLNKFRKTSNDEYRHHYVEEQKSTKKCAKRKKTGTTKKRQNN